MIKETFYVTANFAGKSLNDFLRNMIPSLLNTSADKKKVSNSKIRRLIFTGSVKVNSFTCKNPSQTLLLDQQISVFFDELKFFYEKQPDDIDFTLTEKDVLFEDSDIILVNKPAFLPTESTIVEGRKSLHDAVVSYLWKQNQSLRNPPYAGIMHRLDRETSGVILFTKTRKVNAAVFEMFNSHTAKKTYRAVCCPLGKLSSEFTSGFSFTINQPIGRISARSAKCKMGLLPIDRGGQIAETYFSVAATKQGLYYIDAMPQTGRTHQIRVHLSSIGLPIVGDSLYGGRKGIPQVNFRIMLHASKLEFPHPVSKKMMCIEAKKPDFFDL